MKIELHRSKAGYWWRIVAANHKILATSEMYTRRANAERIAHQLVEESLSMRFVDKTRGRR